MYLNAYLNDSNITADNDLVVIGPHANLGNITLMCQAVVIDHRAVLYGCRIEAEYIVIFFADDSGQRFERCILKGQICRLGLGRVNQMKVNRADPMGPLDEVAPNEHQ